MELRKNILSALFLAIGFVLHSIIPGIVYGVKPDLMLVFIFIIIILYPTIQNTFIIGICGGFLTALTTQIPGGQIGNVVDKIITVFIIYFLVKVLKKYLNKKILAIIIGFFGTIISGSIFISVILLISSINQTFLFMFLTIVLPTALFNAFITLLIQIVLDKTIKRSRLITYLQE